MDNPAAQSLYAVLAALCALAACGAQPARPSSDLEIESTATWECVTGLRDDGGRVLVCTELPEDCRDYRSLGLRWGRMARPPITDVGPCQSAEVGIP